MAWTQLHTITGFDSSTHSSALVGEIVPTIGASDASEVYFVQGTLSAAAAVTIDIRSLTETAFGTALTPTGAYMIFVKTSGTTWRYDPGAANPLSWFLAGTGPQVNGASGGLFAFGATTATTVDNTTRNIRLTNTAGSGTLTYTLAVVLKTA
jgi:hypothetical protein